MALPRQSGELRGHAEQQRQIAAHPVGDVDRLLGVVDADVDVGAEDQLLLGDPAELLGQLLVARPVDDQLVLVERRRDGCRPRRSRARCGAATSRTRAAQLRAAGPPASVTSAHGTGRDLEHRLHQLGLHLAGQRRSGRSPRITLDRLRELERLGIADHQLLLDAERERRPAEPVVQHARGDRIHAGADAMRRRGSGILGSKAQPGGSREDGSQVDHRAEVAAGNALARQARAAAPAALRLRPRQRDPDAAADRPGDRARPPRLLPEPRLEGPRVPVQPGRRGRLLGDRLPDRARRAATTPTTPARCR